MGEIARTDVCSLDEVSDALATLTIGDKDYSIRRLEIGDYAAAQARMRSASMKIVTTTMRDTPSEDAVFALAVAEIASRPIKYTDIWNDFESETFLIHRAMQVNGKGPSHKQVLALQRLDRGAINIVLLWAARLPAVLSKETDRPLDSTAGENSSGPASGGTS